MMAWNSWREFFAMGGYALYVWGSVVAVGAAIAAEVIAVRLRLKAIRSHPDVKKAAPWQHERSGDRA
jgi:heme exporter protein D